MSTVSESSPTAASPLSINGRLQGGQQPVTGATIQLYAANTTTLQGASTPMLNNPVTTDSNGNFSITGDYTCPASNPLVYIVATGGNPGLPGNVNNTGIAMMSMLGSCSNLLANASTTFIFIDELTTAVSVDVLAPFMTGYANVGSAPTGLDGIGDAFTTASDEVVFSTGQFNNGGSSVLDLPEATLNTLADIIAACVNTAAGSSQCSTLFSNTGGSSNTISAALAMIQNPGQNTTPLYNLIASNPPFQPYFTSVPTDFTATVGYTLPYTTVRTGTLDSNGQIWLYYGGYNYNTSTGMSTDSAGYIQVYDNSFNALFTVQPGTGGMYYPVELVPDPSGHVFAINANNTVSEFASNGAAISPSAGWSTGVSSSFSPTATGNNYVTNSNQVDPIVVDALGNIWGGLDGGTSTNCYMEMNSSGTVITPAVETFCAVTGLDSVRTAAVDGQGNAWALGSQSIAQVNSTGSLSATATTSAGCFYPSYTAITSMNPTLGEQQETRGLRYDRVNNHLWGYSYTGAGTVTDAGVPVFCDSGSTALPVLPEYASTSTTVGSAFTGGSLLISNAALDGAGNLWFVTSGVTESGVVASSTSGTIETYTGTAAFQSYLGEISASGTLMTPYNTSTQTYGLQPTGFGPSVTASATNTLVTPYPAEVSILGIDRSGNIWALDAESYKLLKITGLAAANTVNY